MSTRENIRLIARAPSNRLAKLDDVIKILSHRMNIIKANMPYHKPANQHFLDD